MSDEKLLEELKAIKKLLITILLKMDVDAQTLADILSYKSKSSITNDFPIRKLQKGKEDAKKR